MSYKEFLEVVVVHKPDGSQLPIAIIWKDGRRFEIDRVTDICKAASLKVGGRGIRYTCRIRNKQIYLFHDNTQWFIG